MKTRAWFGEPEQDPLPVTVAVYDSENDPTDKWISRVTAWYYMDSGLLYVGEVDTAQERRREGSALNLLVDLATTLDARIIDAARTSDASYALFDKPGEAVPGLRILAD